MPTYYGLAIPTQQGVAYRYLSFANASSTSGSSFSPFLHQYSNNERVQDTGGHHHQEIVGSVGIVIKLLC